MPQLVLIVLALLALGSAARAQDLAPFVLPWDDASAGPTDMSGLSERPAGKSGFVRAGPDGHLYAGQQRIRFWGVNTCFGANFPEKPDAEKVAARMAKFGINAVRFHHMDMFAAPGGIRAKSADTRSLDPENLDRLDYFIAQLKDHGIYADLNLLVSRPFNKADGLPAKIEQLSWKDRAAVGFFYAPEVELQKEYARKLLTHVNPYTKAAYADEPAVGLVEINNENGLAQAWLGGALDKLPPVFAAELQKQWNAWLAKRYGSSEKLAAAWQARDEPAGAQMLAKLSADNKDWRLEQHEGAKAAIQTDADGAAKIQVSQLGKEPWHVQFGTDAMELRAGQVYTLHFRAKAEPKATITVVASQARDPWQSLGFAAQPALTDQWQTFDYTFALGEGDKAARLVFGEMGKQTGAYWLADVSLRPGGRLGIKDGESVEKGTMATFPRTGQGRTAEAQRDWAAFLLDTEYAYWQAMYQFLKTELKVKCPVVGTIVGCSTPNIQSKLDAVDTHAYWQHPSFPKGDWDPGNWTVKNASMVNEAGGILPGLALKRVEGKPLLCTEYNHAAPNTYSSEAPLLVAAYGALQDWDGIFLFAYSHRANDWNARMISSYFDIDQHPTKMANMPIAAAMFRRGDVAAAKGVTHIPMNADDEADLVARKRQGWRLADAGMYGLDGRLSLIRRVTIWTGRPCCAATQPTEGIPPIADPKLLASDTGQLTWDLTHQSKGVVTVDSPRTKSVIGFVDGRSFDLGPVKIAPAKTQQDWCTVSLTLIEGDSFDKPFRAILVATGYAENTGMGWKNPEKTTVGRDWGKAPSLVEVVPANISIMTGGRKLSVWPLDEKGQRGKAIEVVRDAEKAGFQIGPPNQTLWYEIACE